jgi:hypothetical protein
MHDHFVCCNASHERVFVCSPVLSPLWRCVCVCVFVQGVGVVLVQRRDRSHGCCAMSTAEVHVCACVMACTQSWVAGCDEACKWGELSSQVATNARAFGVAAQPSPACYGIPRLCQAQAGPWHADASDACSVSQARPPGGGVPTHPSLVITRADVINNLNVPTWCTSVTLQMSHFSTSGNSNTANASVEPNHGSVASVPSPSVPSVVHQRPDRGCSSNSR